MTRTTQLATILTVAAALHGASTAKAATITYDFGTDPGKTTVADAGFTAITETTPSAPTWTSQVNDVADAAQITGTGSGTASFTNAGFVRTFAGLGGGATNDFTITTTFMLTTYDVGQANNDRIGGIILFADNAVPGATGVDGSGISITPIGSTGATADPFLARNGLSGGTTYATTSLGYDFAVNDTFVLQVDGTFSGTTLNLAMSLSRNGGAAQVINRAFDTVTDAAVLDGTYFGIAQRFKRPTSTEYNSLSVEVVPEPTSLALLGLGGLAMLRRRRQA